MRPSRALAVILFSCLAACTGNAVPDADSSEGASSKATPTDATQQIAKIDAMALDVAKAVAAKKFVEAYRGEVSCKSIPTASGSRSVLVTDGPTDKGTVRQLSSYPADQDTHTSYYYDEKQKLRLARTTTIVSSAVMTDTKFYFGDSGAQIHAILETTDLSESATPKAEVIPTSITITPSVRTSPRAAFESCE